ncbi:hypothetical protein GCM10014715_66010 [Streptomyces spiralis]|uniref:Uncharacterized protein n=1 Tax=Streptomyces spiralis TaxID=66376 RepID=A0A919AEV0_9ACTN|nr:hypothetical protein GCM10014715_66010 [Streptomyces spiralis]
MFLRGGHRVTEEFYDWAARSDPRGRVSLFVRLTPTAVPPAKPCASVGRPGTTSVPNTANRIR